MKNADLPAMPSKIEIDRENVAPKPHQFANDSFVSPGLTKREHFALHLYSGMITACDLEGKWTGTNCASDAVREADDLLAALEE